MSGEPIVIEYTTASGVRIHVTPLALPTVRALQMRAAQELPYPDEKPYEKLMENAVEGTLLPASDNPEYRALCQEIDIQRNELSNTRMIWLACSWPDYSDFKAIVAAFKDRLKDVRKWADLPADDNEAVLFHFVLSGREDVQTVIHAAAQQRPLTNGEIVDGVRLFRINVQLPPARDVA